MIQNAAIIIRSINNKTISVYNGNIGQKHNNVLKHKKLNSFELLIYEFQAHRH